MTENNDGIPLETDRKISEPDGFALLADPQRKRCIEILYESTPPLQVADLAERLADLSDQPNKSPMELEIALHHTHLPMLADREVVIYNQTDNTVEKGTNFGYLISLLGIESERSMQFVP